MAARASRTPRKNGSAGRSRRSARRPKGRAGALAWMGTLVVGTALILGGFGSGVLLGVVTEEPSALASYFTGGTERVALRPESELEGRSRLGRDQAEEALAERSSTEPPTAAEPRVAGAAPPPSTERLPAVSAPPSAGFAVQVGAFSSSDAARAMEAKLEASGYESFVAAGAAARDRRWRVRVGPFAQRDDAERTAKRLERGEGLSTWVVSLADGG